MKKRTQTVIAKRIVKYMTLKKITNLHQPNPFPVSWRTINSIKSSQRKDVPMSCTFKTERKLLDFFELPYVSDDTGYTIIENDSLNN